MDLAGPDFKETCTVPGYHAVGSGCGELSTRQLPE